MEGTWCTPELHFALDNGYEVVKIHEVWHWKEKRPQFFAGFVNKFLKIKTEASGWPLWCTDEAKKKLFLDQVRRHEIDVCRNEIDITLLS